MPTMHWIDWSLVVIPLVALMALALYTRRFVRGVADYIAGGRCAGRYLLANASGEAGSGVTNTIGNFQKFLISGFVLIFWEKLTVPVALILGISGFVVYRYRETRCLTVAQFFEQRYSRSFRIFMGILAFVSGILNYGIFPAVSANFFIYFLGLPYHSNLLGLQVPTLPLLMAAYLSISCSLIFFGGQVTLMVTDCVEGLFTHLVYIIIIVVLMWMIPWNDVREVLTGQPPPNATPAQVEAMAIPPGHSPVNPFDAFAVRNFNPIYTLMGILTMAYYVMVWQGGHGFRAAARTPHEGRMGGVLGAWRGYARGLVLLVLVIWTITFLRHPDFHERSMAVKQEVARIGIDPKNPAPSVYDSSQIGSIAWANDKATDKQTNIRNVPQSQQQQLLTVGLRHLLPTGIKGLFLLVMIMGLFAGDGSHLISWSSIFVQDVVMPLRKDKPLTPVNHLRLLRWAALGTAVWAFLFSWLFALEIDIIMWWAITGVVYCAGAGAVIIAGLYWSRGTSAGAWSAMLVGSILGMTAILAKKFFPTFFSELSRAMPKTLDLGNEVWHSFIIICLAASTYVVVSLLTCKEPADMDRLLHRGKYRIDADHRDEAHAERPSLINRLIGIDSAYTLKDKIVAGFIFWWSMFCVVLNVALVIWHYVIGMHWPHLQMESAAWAQFWLWYGLIIPFLIAGGTLVWFSIGGFIDLKQFFHDLRFMKRDVHDDGTVSKPQEAAPGTEQMAEVAEETAASQRK